MVGLTRPPVSRDGHLGLGDLHLTCAGLCDGKGEVDVVASKPGPPCVAHPGHSVAAAAVPSGQVPVGGALIAAARNVIAQRRAASPATGARLAGGGWL